MEQETIQTRVDPGRRIESRELEEDDDSVEDRVSNRGDRVTEEREESRNEFGKGSAITNRSVSAKDRTQETERRSYCI